jgi:hypothetical protein
VVASHADTTGESRCRGTEKKVTIMSGTITRSRIMKNMSMRSITKSTNTRSIITNGTNITTTMTDTRLGRRISHPVPRNRQSRLRAVLAR